jgi:NAD(P)-dependent dehydrogenase (short-subunit alcohol dehydrogenase family)
MTHIALITGANRGIGYETARLLTERGMTVLLGARSKDEGERAAAALATAALATAAPANEGPAKDGSAVRPVELDVTDEESIRRAAEWIESTYGRLDVLVNNAGIGGFGESGSPSQTPLPAMRAVYETNVFGVMAVTNALLPLLRRAEAARIVNVSTEVGSFASITDPDSPLGRFPPSLPYPSSKAALNMVTVMYAQELADTPIKVNAANPGYCATDFNGHSGFRTATQGAEVSVHLATLDADGPSGVLWGDRWTSGAANTSGVLAW